MICRFNAISVKIPRSFLSSYKKSWDGTMAQAVEHLLCMSEVLGTTKKSPQFARKYKIFPNILGYLLIM
jgi:hypothetical protein